MSLPRLTRTRVVLAVLGVLVAMALLLAVVLINFDWNRARPWLDARASAALQRPFAIRGDLRLTWRRPVDTGAHGWLSWLPWPHLEAHDVHLGNPAALVAHGAPADMASAATLGFSLSPLGLLSHRIVIPQLSFQAPAVLLQRAADNSNNWTFAAPDQPSPWKLDLQGVVFSKGSVHYVDARAPADLTVALDTLSADPRYGVAWSVRGRWNGQPVNGNGKAGAVLSLERQLTPYPIEASLSVGSTSASAQGTLTKPTDLAALDMRLTLAGPSMARLYGLTGLVLPETPPYRTAGHLTGQLGAHGGHWVYEQFTGQVGGSDLAGKLDYQSGRPRGHLTGAVSSTLLQFVDLGPLIGADSNASKEARGVAAVQPSDKVLPVEPFHPERWTSIDADVGYHAKRIVRDRDLPLSDLDTSFHLRDGVLNLTPLNFDVAGGTLRSDILLDGSGKQVHDALRAELKASARHLQLKQLFPTLPAMQATVGEINGDAALSATGNSVASLLGSANGDLKTMINQGSISKLLLEELGLNIGNVVLTKLMGDKPVKLNCMATDFAVTNGLMRTRRFVVDTQDATIHVSGTINLANEKMDLTLKPDSKGLRLFSLRAPIYVRGTFKQPDVSVDKGVLALRAGGALALAVVAPVAAVAPLVSTAQDSPAGCEHLLAEARTPPQAPPPGRRAPAAH